MKTFSTFVRLRVSEWEYLYSQTGSELPEWNRMKLNETDTLFTIYSIFWPCGGTLCGWAADNTIKDEKIKTTTKKMTGSKNIWSFLFVNLVFVNLWICFNNRHKAFVCSHCDTCTVCALETKMGGVGSWCQVNKADLFRQTFYWMLLPAWHTTPSESRGSVDWQTQWGLKLFSFLSLLLDFQITYVTYRHTGGLYPTASTGRGKGGSVPSIVPHFVFLPSSLLPLTWYSWSLPTTANGIISCLQD